jgi:hypothetical protein
MIQQDPLLCHPILDSQPPVVLQYADDTLIILRADPVAASRLKEILHCFAATTGLTINFAKSTLVPIEVLDVDLDFIRQTLGCMVEGFPP